MLPPVSRFLDNGDPDGRLHLQHGPIDLIIGIDDPRLSSADERVVRGQAFANARVRFRTILEELVAELPRLRQPALRNSPEVVGPVARRMMDAVMPFAANHFITPMAAVAGSVADEILSAILSTFDEDRKPARIYVNNGGDIALHLDTSAEFRIRMAHETGLALGDFAIRGTSLSRGIATSGRGGRSLSMGIAESVTILAGNAASADAAATIVGNAVDLPGHPQIHRARAIDVVDDSDLGEHMVVVACGGLTPDEVDDALFRGADMARQLLAAGLIHRAALFLQGRGTVLSTEDVNIVR